ncbi:MAG: hypothetical protein IKD69_07750 [Solobacterium sp.]|nr:hypothetical protein [Solobacterium sp.]
MNKNDMKQAMHHLTLSNHQSDEILRNVLSEKPRKTASFRYLPLAFAAGLLLFLFPGVRVQAELLLQKLQVMLSSESGEQLPMTVEEQEVTYKPTLAAKFDSLAQAEEAFGIDVLDTSDETSVRAGKLLRYDPVILKDENNDRIVAGMNFLDFAYVTGDLKDFKLLAEDDAYVESEFRYQRGEEFGSPIALQMRVILDAELMKEAGYYAADITIPDETLISENESFEIYHINSIDTDALIYTTNNVNGDGFGPAVWESPNPGVEKMVTVTFTYNGVEYSYYGDVSHKSMKAFLETLH